MARKQKVGKERLDKYYRMAKECGYRARSAFKILQLDQKYGLFKGVSSVVDLCGAPGGWSQVAAQKVPRGSLVICVDRDPIKPIPGVTCLTEDITTKSCREKIRSLVSDATSSGEVDLVLNDGAPNVGSAWSKDAFEQIELTIHALRMACEILKPGGSFVTKAFRSKDYPALLILLHKLFRKVSSTKPDSSRDVSAEIFIVCENYMHPPKLDPKIFDFRVALAPTQEKEDSEQFKSNNLAILLRNVPRRNRGGYEESLEGNQTAKWQEFLDSDDPANFLLSRGRLTEVPEDANLDVKDACADLKLAGKKELFAVMKLRNKLVGKTEDKKAHLKGNKAAASSEVAVDLDAEEGSTPLSPEEKIAAEADSHAQRIAKEEKKAQRKRHEMLQKYRKRLLATGDAMDIGETTGLVPTVDQEQVFDQDLENLKKSRVVSMSKESDLASFAKLLDEVHETRKLEREEKRRKAEEEKKQAEEKKRRAKRGDDSDGGSEDDSASDDGSVSENGSVSEDGSVSDHDSVSEHGSSEHGSASDSDFSFDGPADEYKSESESEPMSKSKSRKSSSEVSAPSSLSTSSSLPAQPRNPILELAGERIDRAVADIDPAIIERFKGMFSKRSMSKEAQLNPAIAPPKSSKDKRKRDGKDSKDHAGLTDGLTGAATKGSIEIVPRSLPSLDVYESEGEDAENSAKPSLKKAKKSVSFAANGANGRSKSGHESDSAYEQSDVDEGFESGKYTFSDMGDKAGRLPKWFTEEEDKFYSVPKDNVPAAEEGPNSTLAWRVADKLVRNGNRLHRPGDVTVSGRKITKKELEVKFRRKRKLRRALDEARASASNLVDQGSSGGFAGERNAKNLMKKVQKLYKSAKMTKNRNKRSIDGRLKQELYKKKKREQKNKRRR